MRVLVTGSNGLCGSAIKRLSSQSSHDFTFITRDDGDLRSKECVKNIFKKNKPDYVIHTAARVGGILGNEKAHETFFYENILINANVIHECVINNVKKLFAFSSVCVFPDDLSQLDENKMHNGPVFESNFAYGYAKRMVDVHIRSSEKQYGVKNWVSVIPGNIFGPNDLYSIDSGHLMPALIHKLYLARRDGTNFTVWGDGKSLREFIYVDDLARMLIDMLDIDTPFNKIIISGRKEFSIKEVVDILLKVSNFQGRVVWDKSKPNGQRTRVSSKNRVDSLFNDFEYTSLESGIKACWDWFVENYPNVRTTYHD